MWTSQCFIINLDKDQGYTKVTHHAKRDLIGTPRFKNGNENTENLPIAKSFDSGQTAQIAQADQVR